MHVPKTAGSSVAKGLVEQASRAGINVCNFLFASDLVFFDDVNGLDGYEMFAGHIGHDQIKKLIGPCAICTFYREPIDRVLSNYFWWRSQHPDELLEVDGRSVKLVDTALSWEDDLSRILQNKENCWKFNELSNIQSYQTAFRLYGRLEGPRHTLSRAVENASRFFFCGFYETLEEDFSTLSRRLFDQEVPVSIGHEKLGPDKPSVSELDPSIKNLIIEKNEIDIAFYEELKRLPSNQWPA